MTDTPKPDILKMIVDHILEHRLSPSGAVQRQQYIYINYECYHLLCYQIRSDESALRSQIAYDFERKGTIMGAPVFVAHELRTTMEYATPPDFLVTFTPLKGNDK